MSNRTMAVWVALLASAFVASFVVLIAYEFGSGGSRGLPPPQGMAARLASEEAANLPAGVPGKTIVLEAEQAELTGLTTGSDERASGGRYVEGFDSAGDTLRFGLELDEPGMYMVRIRYKTFGGDKPNKLLLNGKFIREYPFKDTADWEEAAIGQLELREGRNTFEIANAWGWIGVDYAAFTGGPGGPVRNVTLDIEGGMREGAADAPVTLTAQADNAAEYRFHVRKTGGAWQPINDYGIGHSVIWLPPAVGSYELKASARGLGSGADSEAYAALPYRAHAEHAGKPLVSPMFGDRMVLQRDTATTIWGWAEPGREVEVRIGGRSFKAFADEAGKWRAAAGPFPAGGPHTITVSSGEETVTFEDVLFGDVWLAAGQSNMEWRLSQTIDGSAEIARADDPNIRYLQLPARTGAVPLYAPGGQPEWQSLTRQSAPELSAVAYFFARKLTEETGVPIGIVQAAVGGSKAETWLSLEAARTIPGLAGTAEAVRIGEAAIDPLASPTVLYNGMIAPTAPYGLKGVLWYQGESNAGEPGYHRLLPALIADWRHAYGQADLPFVIVQLSSFGAMQSEDMPVHPHSGFAVVREAQLAAAEGDPHACLAVTTDVGDPADIHPTNKQDVGYRAALCALGAAYGLPVVHTGPVLVSAEREGGRIRLGFKHAGSGLTAGRKAGLGPMKPLPGGKPDGFAVAGADGVYHWADAAIEGDEVVVSSAEVAAPVSVRYGWADSPIGNLYNLEGLPAPPFRTDALPVLDVVEGSGGGEYAPGETVEIIAYPAKEGRFVKWIGDVSHLDDPASRRTTVRIPDEPYIAVAPLYARE